ncbi:MAG: cupin domain-containing protein [Chloroflexi bacterium]|nr:cupin domain-containing protein [Chloroflexota bacterium]
MAEREALREREREPEVQRDMFYESRRKLWADRWDRAETGKVVIRGKEQPWLQGRQGFVRYYLDPTVPGPAVWNWLMFIHKIRAHSGRHIHQGGIALFVLEGKGYTVVDGHRFDWEEGDLILLPIKPHGCEHQHFNVDPEKPSQWLAFIFYPFYDFVGSVLKQVEDHPDWKEG